jgi:hypothetical protein
MPDEPKQKPLPESYTPPKEDVPQPFHREKRSYTPQKEPLPPPPPAEKKTS